MDVVELDAALAPTSTPRRLSRTGTFINSLAWSRDGRFIVYTSQSVPLLAYLWRVDVDGKHPPQRIEVAGLAAMPVTVRSADRLAFARIVADTDVYRFQVGRPSQPVVASTFLDAETRFSPDGRRLAAVQRVLATPPNFG